jgi:hypothetical protein
MQRLVCFVSISALALLTACGGGRPAATRAGASPAPASHHGGGHHGGGHHGGGHHAPASADSAAGYVSSEIAPRHQRPQERPGLGTVWGEDLVSHVGVRPFERAASAPFATVTVHYNDEEGVAAHADFRGGFVPAPYRARTPQGGISVALVDEHGAVWPGGVAGGRALVLGREGARYRIVIENATGGRYEVVASVDGLDVIDGRAAHTGKRGYLLEPHASLVIDGFRRSDSRVAAFRFGRVADSYAAQTTGDRNVGVVGMAFFAERGSPWTSDELHRRDTADPFPADRTYARPPY